MIDRSCGHNEIPQRFGAFKVTNTVFQVTDDCPLYIRITENDRASLCLANVVSIFGRNETHATIERHCSLTCQPDVKSVTCDL